MPIHTDTDLHIYTDAYLPTDTEHCRRVHVN